MPLLQGMKALEETGSAMREASSRLPITAALDDKHA